MVSSLSCRTTFISFTCPWHATHDTPLFTWTAWLKYAYSGSLWTRFHSTGLPVSTLARTGASSGLLPFTFAFFGLWQFMHVCEAGTLACGDSKTGWWQ